MSVLVLIKISSLAVPLPPPLELDNLFFHSLLLLLPLLFFKPSQSFNFLVVFTLI